jgi:hypothetical protein
LPCWRGDKIALELKLEELWNKIGGKTLRKNAEDMTENELKLELVLLEGLLERGIATSRQAEQLVDIRRRLSRFKAIREWKAW